MGEQYVEWADSASTIRRIPRPEGMEHTPRPVANKIKHFVLSQQAKVLETRPTKDVLPATDDPVNISASMVANAYLDWLCEDQIMNWDGVLAQAVLWALAGTQGFIKWIWNPRLDNGVGGKGRCDAVACSPLDIYPDPYAKSFKQARYVIHSQFMDVEHVYDVYGVEMKPTDVDKADPTRVALMREMGMAPVLEGVIINELWMKPNRRHPNGMYVVWAHNKVLVHEQPFPYDHGRLPFTQIGQVMRPGTLHYTSNVSDLRAPQMELNKFHAQMIQVREAFANPKWFIPSEVEMESDPDDSPNQILRGNLGGNPQMMPKIIQPMMMPPNDAGTWIANEMMDIVGVHEVSDAQVPGRVEAAKAIELLKETDDTRLAELLRTIRVSISEGFYQLLRLTKQYGSEDVEFMAYSREGMPEVRRFNREQLHPGMRIRVTMGTGLARSRAARTDQLMLMWDNGIIQDRELMAELMDLPISSVSPDNMFDIKLARNENYKMAESIAVTPNSWDNHDIHRREHNNYRKTTEYALLGAREKQLFEYHCQMHDELQVQQLGKQLQIQQMAGAVAQGAGFQGGGPGGGPPVPGAPAPGGAGKQQGPASHQASMRIAHSQPHGGQQHDATGHTVGAMTVPNAVGASPPPNPNAIRHSPQGLVSYQNRYANDLAKLGQVPKTRPH
jgi:hypothetical protein